MRCRHKRPNLLSSSHLDPSLPPAPPAAARYQRAIRDAQGAVHQLRSALSNTAEKATLDQVVLPRLEGERGVGQRGGGGSHLALGLVGCSAVCAMACQGPMSVCSRLLSCFSGSHDLAAKTFQ